MLYEVITNASLDFFVDLEKLDGNAFSRHVGNDVSLYPRERLAEVLVRMGEDKLRA